MALARTLGAPCTDQCRTRVANQAELLVLMRWEPCGRSCHGSRVEYWSGQFMIGSRALGRGDVRGMAHGVDRRAETLRQAATIDRALKIASGAHCGHVGPVLWAQVGSGATELPLGLDRNGRDWEGL